MLAYPFTQKGPFEISQSPEFVGQSPASFEPTPDVSSIPPLPTMTSPVSNDMLAQGDDYFQFFPEDFDIGNAIVASGGPNGWTSNSFGQDHMQDMSHGITPLNGPLIRPQDHPRSVSQSHAPELAQPTHSSTLFESTSDGLDMSQYLDYSADIAISPYTYSTDLGAG